LVASRTVKVSLSFLSYVDGDIEEGENDWMKNNTLQ
jgi:hypothetical protein